MLEWWPGEERPGSVGSGRTWRDGDLTYLIQARANAFEKRVPQRSDAGEVFGRLSDADPNQQPAIIARAHSSTPLSADGHPFAEAVQGEGVGCSGAAGC